MPDGIQGLGEDTFLRLLTTQLQYQDPLNPMDSTQFVAQLAQFSQLEQTTNLKKAMETSVQYMSSLNNYSAASLVGHEVRAAGDVIGLTDGAEPALAFSLSSDAAQVRLQILDASGVPVQTLAVGPQAAGGHSVVWDGTNAAGLRLPPGSYRFEVNATDNTGGAVASTLFTQGRVTGVTFDNNVAYFLINGSRIPASGIVEISNPVN